jgi:hypothetical protein
LAVFFIAFIDNNIMNILTGTGTGNDSTSSIASVY